MNNCPKAESLRVFLEKGLVKLSNYQNRSQENERKKEKFAWQGHPEEQITVKASFLLRATQQLSSFNTFASRTRNLVNGKRKVKRKEKETVPQ